MYLLWKNKINNGGILITLFKDPNKKGLIVILTFLGLLALCAPSHCLESIGIEKAILHLMRTRPNSRLVRSSTERRELAGEIISAADEFWPRPYVLTSIFYSESTFNKDARGGAGEKGIGQHGFEVRKQCEKAGFNLKLRSEQVNCTAWTLAKQERKCGTLEGALTAYVGWGTCKTGSKKKQKQVQYKLKVARKLQKIGESP
jgi:hypothetical protein